VFYYFNVKTFPHRIQTVQRQRPPLLQEHE